MGTKTAIQQAAEDQKNVSREFDPSRDHLPAGQDVMVTQYTVTILPVQVPGQSRPQASQGQRVLIMIADEDVPSGSDPYTEAMRKALAICPPGRTVSVPSPGRRMPRRVVD